VAQFLALAGFMGSGKSSVGAAAAARLGWRFIDLDAEFEVRFGTTIPVCFESEGEEAFRTREHDVLAAVIDSQDNSEGLVVALGGGTLENAKSRELLCSRGGLILLDIEAGEAWTRVKGSDRPLAQDQEAFEVLWRQRRANYESAVDWVLPAKDRKVEDLAGEISYLVRSAGREWPGLWGRRLTGTERPSLIVGGEDALSFLAARAAHVLENGGRLHLVTDKNVMQAWGERVVADLGGMSPDAPLVVDPGEESKSPASLGRCWDWLADRGARRQDVVVALGGGVVGDLAGFAAATYHRGVALWQVPTTLLAQVDSSVGGKTAVNLPAGKNLVGAFYQPDLVVIDPATLATLPAHEYLGGLGEVVKHALLSSADALDRLESVAKAVRDRERTAVNLLLKRNVAVKAAIVEQDEREAGRRAVLNLGHTTAHAVELLLGYGKMSHGQAVALGLLVALAVSETVLGLDSGVRARTKALLGGLGLETSAVLPSADALCVAAARDKKVRADTSGFVGLRAVGEPVWGMDVPSAVLASALEVIRR
jgi:shikimate kinase/3-dehydroquinate synthase